MRLSQVEVSLWSEVGNPQAQAVVRKALQHSWVYLISRCSAISPSPTPTPTVWPLCPRFYQLLLFSSQNAMIEKAVNTLSSFLTKTMSQLVEKDVSPPHPGAQSHAWGAGVGAVRCAIHRSYCTL